MEKEFWNERWQKREIAFHQRDINVSLQRYWPVLGLPAGAVVFVPLCGKSLDMLWLRAQGHVILGNEFIEAAVRDFFAENRLTPVVSAKPPFERWEADGIAILRGDFFAMTAADVSQVRGVYDRAALIALPPPMRRRYAEHMTAILPEAAQMLVVALSYPQHEMQGPPFAVTAEEVQSLYAGAFDIERLAAKDILSAESKFRERGLTRLVEDVYRLRRKTS